MMTSASVHMDRANVATIAVLAALVIGGWLIERRTMHRHLRGRQHRAGMWLRGRAVGAPRARGWYVYVHTAIDAEVRYIGKTDHPHRRFSEHVRDHPEWVATWARWQTFRCATESEALMLEAHLIRLAAQQRHRLQNTQHNPNRGRYT